MCLGAVRCRPCPFDLLPDKFSLTSLGRLSCLSALSSSPGLILAASVCPSLLFRYPQLSLQHKTSISHSQIKAFLCSTTSQNINPVSSTQTVSLTKKHSLDAFFFNHILTPIFIPTIRFPFAPRHPFSLPSHLHKKSFLLFPIHHSTSRFSKTKNPQTTTQPILPKNHQDQQPPPHPHPHPSILQKRNSAYHHPQPLSP